jgi:hypothetical protein
VERRSGRGQASQAGNVGELLNPRLDELAVVDGLYDEEDQLVKSLGALWGLQFL